MNTNTSKILGINGLGRIGKLTLWHHAGRKFFDEIVINVGREVGTGMNDLIHYIERDSTYGRLEAFIHGFRGEPVITDVDPDAGTLMVNGVKIKILSTDRNPKDIAWADHNVELVVDTTGQFLDPNLESDAPKGSIRGHLEAGARKVIASAPFKLKQGATVPDDAVTTVMGINDKDYDPVRHCLISNASCTTTCLSHMIKPLLDAFGLKRLLSASMATIHAATGSQEVLDRLPKTGKTDLRKNRSIMNNIILTTTGAAKALQQVIPEMANIGFIAESVRIPTATGSLIVLVINLQEELNKPPIKRERINQIYKDTAQKQSDGYLIFTEEQNVSSDIIGTPRAAAVIEGHETHTRTACISINLEHMQGIEKEVLENFKDRVCAIQVTQAVIYGWYDNEMASYVNMLGDRTVTVAESME
ncbi:glyceraldehyde-3-phosphate dehydrogenase [Desulfobacter hydrogenophilus]|uniref:Glyceraldehyde-3-phosphate dehydrogenase n=1 Tax=Desulfobacter hydrogenophilus TaxID=2291 RepID=A0A328FFZ0_9BACT|nr:glyceraldehyde 3-phosphate dehydrogenase NAD-binding domain-containing protein [Desulfobacter hydrogenophilus]NDY72706.1 glyceraldehyde-3-phosphate dehydrogenase [Desulfobacter hydrogenophilus]QBH12543.1 glyceraldehyde-3-phosphate dehydrogenase [Desulfobacter hydrogenophilus]RAM03279.1 glyceraldehyde-3-phosphate dehydrogenase [Desulfobacter hydrogenophilus]